MNTVIKTISLLVLLLPLGAAAQEEKLSPEALKKLSVEELMDVEVTLVSRSPQKLTEAASAIQVITGDDIRRSGATSLPEALRLVSNLQAAQLQSNAWIISSRGFNTIFANKLLVMIDGRTVYTPLFGGVVWELQNVLLEDVDRIEVVSGPGGSLWGANAVNGVINIVTRSSKETQGLYGSLAAGTFVKDMAALRYGGTINDQISYRVYGQHFDREATRLPSGAKNHDAWGLSQGGFRLDWNASASDQLSVQGDYFGGAREGSAGKSAINGQNVLGRWNHTVSNRSDLSLQLYFDRYDREDKASASDTRLHTFDLDFQHRFPLGKRQSILWGAGARLAQDSSWFATNLMGILPTRKRLDLYSGFLQDEVSLGKRLKLTVGTKLLHNVYTGFELQPGARFALTVRKDNLLWGAVSRAVRTPSRYDVDYYLPAYPVPPTSPSVAGGPNFVSEKMVAYELGYRIRPNAVSNFSAAVFYNRYRDVYSVEALPGTLTYQIQNGSEGASWGLELSGTYKLTNSWRLRGGYTYFDKDLHARPGHVFDPAYLGNDVKHQGLLHSILDLPFHLQLDLTGRYLDRLSKTLATAEVPPYVTYDARLAYTFKKGELSVVGQNLHKDKHAEFGTLQIPRSVYLKITGRF
ncbi:TonB-dependent receptor plug domain-containing protein [Paraflavisolibacter sp. H34]|uniref:TonB-dependent receptor plug domain-containing protein n=1 Tax=Huijunlia imazamoxiresistens TaxID=3127457 RepID=UPI0030169816